MLFLLSSLLAFSLAPSDTSSSDGVIIVRDALDASLAILERRAAGLIAPAAAWDSLFATEGYLRLKGRELALRRPFTDSAFRAFLLSDTLLARLPDLRRAADTWRSVDLDGAVARARAYLPPGTPIRARLYPLIKPATNSFVHPGPDGVMGIFVYVDPAQPPGEARMTLAHELHHVGFSAACRGAADSAASRAEQTLLTRLGGFGEGLAMLAAAGSPDRNPVAEFRPEMRILLEPRVAEAAGDLARVDSLIVDVATGRVTSPDSVTRRATDFYGLLGPWYTVGWLLGSTVERALGRDRLIEVMCDPRLLILEYQTVAERSQQSLRNLPFWSRNALRWLSQGRG